MVGHKWRMKSRRDIVENWLPRYTGVPLKDFGEYILLTNFDRYVHLFAQWHRVPIRGKDKPMPNATAGDITIINFGMGSATAATVMDLLSAIKPKAVLFLGKCGGVKHRAEIGDLILSRKGDQVSETEGRGLQLDQKWIAGKSPGTWKAGLSAARLAPGNFQGGANGRSLYMEYTVADQ